jgi:hypothetical protein
VAAAGRGAMGASVVAVGACTPSSADERKPVAIRLTLGQRERGLAMPPPSMTVPADTVAAQVCEAVAGNE